MAASIEDVARVAGVSIATVSRALRGLPDVAASTRGWVLSAAEQLNYVASPLRLDLPPAGPRRSGWSCRSSTAGSSPR